MTSSSLNSRVAKFDEIVTNADAWAKGDASTSVDFGGGPVRSPAKLIADKATEINTAKDQLISQKDAEINQSANGVLAQATQQASNAQQSATAAEGIAAQFGDVTGAIQAATDQANISTGKAIEAGGSASSASASSDQAKSYADAAKTSSDNAEVQAAIVTAGQRMYATTAAGIAATTNGQMFLVPSTVQAAAFDVWQNSAGVAQPVLGADGTQIRTLSSKSIVNTVVPTAYGLEQIWIDALGFIGRTVKADGTRKEIGVTLDPVNGNVSVGSISLSGSVAISDGVNITHTVDPYGIATVDALGFVGAATRSDGSAVQAIVSGSSAADELLYRARNANNLAASNAVKNFRTTRIARAVSGYCHMLGWGQSNSIGQEGWPGISTANYDGNVMVGLCVGQHNNAGTATYQPVGDSAFRPLVAVPAWPKGTTAVYSAAEVAAFSAGNASAGETNIEGLCNGAKRLLNFHNGVTSDPSTLFVGTTVGISGYAIAGLNKSSGNWGRYTGAVQTAKNNATAAGKGYMVAGLFGNQGEADSTVTPQATYQATQSQLYDDFVADCAVGIAGQAYPPGMYDISVGSYAPGAGGDYSLVNQVPQAKLELAKARPDEIFLVAPQYHVTDKGIHKDCNGHRWLGYYFAKVWYLTAQLRQRWLPLHMRSATIKGNIVAIDFHVPAPPLQWDAWYDGFVARNDADGGFKAGDKFGLIPVVSKRIVFDTIVELVLQRPPIGAAYLWYTDGTASGGNLRDSDTWIAGDNYIYNAGTGQYAASNVPALVGKPYPLFNWCVPCRLQLQ